jgi:hypothetical protein
MTRKKMFVALPEGVGKLERIEIRVTSEESVKLRRLAAIRQMSLSDFLRRAGLGRATPVDFETDLILGLCDVARAIRELHKGYLDAGFEPPETILLPVMNATKLAILQVGERK